MKKWIVGLIVAVVVLGVAAFAGWYFVIRSDAKPRAAIAETPVQTGSGTSADGSYTIAPGSSSFVGYRVNEVVFGQSQTTTGRTGGVTGSLTLSGTTANGVTVTADMTKLASDNDRRDGRAKSALGTDRFPNATFVLTEPIRLSGTPTAGQKVTATATGDLTVHGITKRVQIPIEGRWDGTQVQVVGHLPLTFSDYGVSVGDFQPLASVEPNGEMELQLFFAKT